MEKRLKSSSSPTSIKWEKREPQFDPSDCISQLPDEILIFILSRLTLKEAAATSILSSRWMHLWTFHYHLNFIDTKTLDTIELTYSLLKKDREKRKFIKKERVKYVKWVNKVLDLHKGLRLEEFRIRFDLCSRHQRHIDKWLKFVLARRVERLDLDLTETEHDFGCFDKLCTFPMEIFAQPRNSPLNIFVGFKTLKELCLKYVNVTGDVLESFLSNCQVLERLAVVGSGQLVKFDVCGPSISLRYLEICDCLNLKSVKICHTNLASVKFLGQLTCLQLNDLPLLVEVYIGNTEFVREVPLKLSSCFSQLENLTLYTPDNEDGIMQLQEFPELPRLKQLVIRVQVCYNRSLMGFTSLLKASPFLQKLVFELIWMYPDRRERRKLKKPPKCHHHHIKVVKVAGYYGRTSDLEVIRYLLKNARALEELIIDPCDQLFMNSRTLLPSKVLAREEAARNCAKQQLGKEKVPKRVNLSIL